MNTRDVSTLRLVRGHTLIELMVAIIIGMILVLAAFKVMATFEGNKRTTTAMNDAMQSGNFGLYEIDKLVRSAGTGLSKYASFVGYGCALDYTPPGSTLITSGVTAAILPAPFTSVVGTSSAPLRLVPVIIFPGASTVGGSTASLGGAAATSDELLVMLGGGGFGEVPIKVNSATGPNLDSTVGFSAGESVLVGGSAIGDCMITTVTAGFTGWAGGSVVLPLTDTTLGAKTLATNDYILGLGKSTAANFMMYGVDGTSNSLRSLDLLNSALTTAQNVSDDVVIMRAVYAVDPGNTGTITWINPGSSVTATISGVSTTLNYAATSGTDCLLCGTATANLALEGIKAIRVALIVRAPLDESAATTATYSYATSYPMFSNLSGLTVTWYVPNSTTQNYRYRELETTIPVRNNVRDPLTNNLSL